MCGSSSARFPAGRAGRSRGLRPPGRAVAWGARQVIPHGGGELERPQPRPVIVDLRGQDELIGAGAADQLGESVENRAGRADGGAGEDVVEESGLLG